MTPEARLEAVQFELPLRQLFHGQHSVMLWLYFTLRNATFKSHMNLLLKS